MKKGLVLQHDGSWSYEPVTLCADPDNFQKHLQIYPYDFDLNPEELRLPDGSYLLFLRHAKSEIADWLDEKRNYGAELILPRYVQGVSIFELPHVQYWGPIGIVRILPPNLTLDDSSPLDAVQDISWEYHVEPLLREQKKMDARSERISYFFSNYGYVSAALTIAGVWRLCSSDPGQYLITGTLFILSAFTVKTKNQKEFEIQKSRSYETRKRQYVRDFYDPTHGLEWEKGNEKLERYLLESNVVLNRRRGYKI
jgi:hypothetical protein